MVEWEKKGGGKGGDEKKRCEQVPEQTNSNNNHNERYSLPATGLSKKHHERTWAHTHLLA